MVFSPGSALAALHDAAHERIEECRHLLRPQRRRPANGLAAGHDPFGASVPIVEGAVRAMVIPIFMKKLADIAFRGRGGVIPGRDKCFFHCKTEVPVPHCPVQAGSARLSSPS